MTIIDGIINACRLKLEKLDKIQEFLIKSFDKLQFWRKRCFIGRYIYDEQMSKLIVWQM